MAPLTLKYLSIKPLAGRGGVVRFFMLIHGLDFEEKLIPMTEWGSAKAKMIESKENPSGTVPILTVNDDESVPDLTQHISLCRYLFHTKITDVEVTPIQEMLQDMVADEYQGWRNAWGATLGSEDVKTSYKADQLNKYLALFNALYEKYATAHPFLSTTSSSKPLWADVAIASLIYDHIETGLLTKEGLKAYPMIESLFTAFSIIDCVALWIEQAKKV